MGVVLRLCVTAAKMREEFQADLLEGEEILWTGRPERSAVVAGADAAAIPITVWLGSSAIYAGVSLLHRLSAANSLGQLVTSLVGGIPFILMGLYLILGRFIYKAWRKTRTYYAVTNKRVLALTKIRGRHLLEEYIEEIPALHKSVRSDGIGSVYFARSPFMASWCGNAGMNCSTGFDRKDLMAFHDIRGAEEVYGLVEALRNGGSGPNGLRVESREA